MRVRLVDDKLGQSIDLRTFSSVGAANVMMPTSAGVKVRLPALSDMVSALQLAGARASELGWTGGAA
jgi:hypothetical protein